MVTIGVPVRNGAHHLEGCLRQLLAQTHKNTQILISDNNSTDDTNKICRFWARKNRKIGFYRQSTTLNVTENFNFLFSKAKSQYFMWAAVDDEWDNKFIQRCIEKFKNDSKCVLAFCDFSIKYREIKRSNLISVQSSCAKSIFIRFASRCLDIQPHLIYGLMDREKLKKIKLKNIDFFDCLFSLEAAKCGNIRIVDEPLFSWKISTKRKSYSIHGNDIKYFPFFFSAMKATTDFSPLKKLFVAFTLLYYLAAKKCEHIKNK